MHDRHDASIRLGMNKKPVRIARYDKHSSNYWVQYDINPICLIGLITTFGCIHWHLLPMF